MLISYTGDLDYCNETYSLGFSVKSMVKKQTQTGKVELSKIFLLCVASLQQ